MPGDRRASDADLARVLRFLDGTGDDPGCIVRVDRMERLLRLLDGRSMRSEARLRVLYAMAKDHPLMDKQIAAEVVAYVKSGEDRARRFGIVAGYVGRQSVATIFSVVNMALLAWLAWHGFAIAPVHP